MHGDGGSTRQHASGTWTIFSTVNDAGWTDVLLLYHSGLQESAYSRASYGKTKKNPLIGSTGRRHFPTSHIS